MQTHSALIEFQRIHHSSILQSFWYFYQGIGMKEQRLFKEFVCSGLYSKDLHYYYSIGKRIMFTYKASS